MEHDPIRILEVLAAFIALMVVFVRVAGPNRR